MVMVIVALLLVPILETLAPKAEEELIKLGDDEIPGSAAPIRTAMTKFAPGTWAPVKVDFI